MPTGSGKIDVKRFAEGEFEGDGKWDRLWLEIVKT